jgi:hypothetical protein
MINTSVKDCYTKQAFGQPLEAVMDLKEKATYAWHSLLPLHKSQMQ